MSDPNSIASELADKIMSACNRICCVCRDYTRPVQIQRIDENLDNNAFENLAALCGDCRPEAHAGIPRVRGLTPRQLKMFNQSWRLLVKLSTRLSQKVF